MINTLALLTSTGMDKFIEGLMYYWSRFSRMLPHMGIGMLGVFMIVGIIILSTYVIGKATGNQAKND